jgi:serine/threonine protein kinase
VKEELVAAVAMECFDLDGSNIWRPLGRRFRKGEVADLLRDVQSVLRGTVQATVWMHKSGLAHGDLKDSNMLLKRLAQTPADPRIAFCVVGGVTYQIVFSDWGHARWSGQNEKASHAFSKLQHGGKEHCTTHIIDAASKMDRISPVQLRELNLAYGFQLRNPSVFRHPGSGTVLFRCPEYDREFKSGEGAVQRRFDQAADMWALGVLGVYLLAPPLLQDGQTDAHLRDSDWAGRLKKASSTAERKLKAERSSGARLGGKAMDAALQPDDSGSWIATMVRVHYKKNLWPILKDLLSGERNSEWLSWLDLLHGLLTYSSEVRLQANDALEHHFFSMDL